MPTPTFSVINGQVPTALRVYDYFDKKNAYRSECAEAMRDCRFRLLAPSDYFLPFQFVRPFSVLGIDSFKVFNLAGSEIVSYTAGQIAALLTIEHMDGVDFVTYTGRELISDIPEGFHYFEIVTTGRTFASEDFYVQCETEDGHTIDECNMFLTWTNCGDLGNIHYGDMTQKYYLPLDTMKPRASTELKIEVEEDEDGEQREVHRRRETEWTVFVGIVPWFVVDALSAMCLHDTVELNYTTTGGADRLLHPRITAERNDSLSKCMVPVTLTFQIENDSVACCDVFDRPCLESCITAAGYTSDVSPTFGNYYLRPSEPRYAQYNGSSFDASILCDSGLADIGDVDVDGYTVAYDVNDEEWVPVAENTLATVGTDCVVTLQFAVIEGYSAMLQYINVDDEWTDDAEWFLSSSEWDENTTTREVPEDQHEDNRVRLKVMCPNGQTVLGYSEEVTYACA